MIDRGRNYQSVVFMGACEYLRINVQSARPYRGSDKGWIERLFRTMRERLLESLPGYTGPNVLARGKDVEADLEISRTSWRRSSAAGSSSIISAARMTGCACRQRRTSA